MNDRLVYGMEPRSAHFCRVTPKVGQATGFVFFQDLDQPTGSAILLAYESYVTGTSVSQSYNDIQRQIYFVTNLFRLLPS